MRNPDSNKAHGHDMISIYMSKLCGNSICQFLEIISKTCLRNDRFPRKSKKANVVPIHKKGDQQTTENYGPVSLLPICGKIFERLLYDNLFIFFLQIIYFFQISLVQTRELLYKLTSFN